MGSLTLKSPQFALNSRNCFWASDNGSRHSYSSSFSFSCFSPAFSQKLRVRGNSAIVAAAKKENNSTNKRKKDDTHSFVARPDEATGPFPEAVLLKQRTVEEDGRLMPEFADAEERELFESLNLQLESDMDVDRMRHYEVVYLIHENRTDEVEDVNTKVQEFLKEKKGKIWRFSDWGLRSLAYKIQKANKAHYILMNFELEAKWINDFKSMLDRDERVIRHLVMKQDEAKREVCPPPPEFHTVQADMNDDADDEEDVDYDDEEWEDEEYDDEEWDDEGDDEDWDGDGDDEGIIYVDDDDAAAAAAAAPPNTEMSSSFEKTKQTAEKVGR